MSIFYKFKKLKVKWSRSKDKDLELNDFQKKTYDIVIKLINDKNSVLMLDVDGRKCIKNKNILVTMIKNYIIIKNGANYCKDYFDDRIRDQISYKFNNKLIRKINILDSQSMSTIEDNLDNIMQELSQHQESIEPDND